MTEHALGLVILIIGLALVLTARNPPAGPYGVVCMERR